MSPAIASTAVIHPNVELGEGCRIEEYVIVGAPLADGESPPTVIGPGALIRSHTVIYAGNTIGARFQSGNKTNIRERNTIGDDVSIGTLSVVEHHVAIGDRVRIHTQAFIPEYSILEEDAWIGPNVVLTNAKYPRSPGSREALMGPRVGRNAKIGANATLLPGVVIGRDALVGAGSVVTEDVTNGTIVVGNPARLLGPVGYR